MSVFFAAIKENLKLSYSKFKLNIQRMNLRKLRYRHLSRCQIWRIYDPICAFSLHKPSQVLRIHSLLAYKIIFYKQLWDTNKLKKSILDLEQYIQLSDQTYQICFHLIRFESICRTHLSISLISRRKIVFTLKNIFASLTLNWCHTLFIDNILKSTHRPLDPTSSFF